jgi:predicted dehydrogenase
MKTIRVGLIGSQFVSSMHFEALRFVEGAEVFAVASPTEAHVRSFAEQRNIPHWFTDYRKLLAMDELDMLALGLPNDLHGEVTLAAAAAGKHVVVEKPMAMNLEDFENGATAYIEEAWTKLGGMDDRAELHGTQGVAYADLLRGSSILTYSERGYGYAVEKAGTTSGWSFTMFEEAWNYGFPQEFQHFVECVRDDRPPQETGHDGRIVLETLMAAYASAGSGRRVALPFATTARSPYACWRSDEA